MKSLILFLLLGICFAFHSPCDNEISGKRYKFCDTSLSFEQRAAEIVKLLSLDEKVNLFQNEASSIPSLNITSYEWWNEALHGVANSRGVSFGGNVPFSTVFPQVIVSASSFNTTLFKKLGEAISTEARAFNNAGHAGLTFWAPNVNIFRDPRWGRGQETPGEDPKLTSDYAENYVQGMQGDDEKYLKTSACCKHFWGYNLEKWKNNDRLKFNGRITKQDAIETYLPTFAACVKKGKASSVMCSYNSINGIPSCANKELLTDLLRDEWKFDGYVTGDCGAVEFVEKQHHYTASGKQTAAATLNAGVDIDCGTYLPKTIKSAIEDNYVQESVLDHRLRNLFKVQLRLGLFDVASKQPYRSIGIEHIRTTKHLELAKEAARQGFVLLKNEHATLPLLKNSINSIGVIGSVANNSVTPLGNYFGVAEKVWTPLEGIQNHVNDANIVTKFAKGTEKVSDTSEKLFTDALHVARDSDVVLLFAGVDNTIESEGLDREEINFPGAQEKLVMQCARAAKQLRNKKVVLVVSSGGAVDLNFAKQSELIDAIVWMGYGGEFAGTVLAEVLFGDVNPSGKLTQTFYPREFVDQVSFFELEMRPNDVLVTPGRGYRFYTKQPVYAFGHGLSYTNFVYEQIFTSSNSKQLMKSENPRYHTLCFNNVLDQEEKDYVTIKLVVRNVGEYPGADVMLAFAHPPEEIQQQNKLLKKLVSYSRSEILKVQEDSFHTFKFSTNEFSLADSKGHLQTAFGKWTVKVGDTPIVFDVLSVTDKQCARVQVQKQANADLYL